MLNLNSNSNRISIETTEISIKMAIAVGKIWEVWCKHLVADIRMQGETQPVCFYCNQVKQIWEDLSVRAHSHHWGVVAHACYCTLICKLKCIMLRQPIYRKGACAMYGATHVHKQNLLGAIQKEIAMYHRNTCFPHTCNAVLMGPKCRKMWPILKNDVYAENIHRSP